MILPDEAPRTPTLLPPPRPGAPPRPSTRARPAAGARAASVLLAGAVALLLVGCGGGEDGPPSGTDDPNDTVPGEPATPGAGEPSAGTSPDGPGTPPDSSAVPSPPSTWAYTCPDGLRIPVDYRSDEARVTLPAREYRLPAVPAASGAKYQAGDTIWWDKGGEALLETGDERHAGCTGVRADSPDDAVRRLGFDFRGRGQEPGWIVELDLDRQLRWTGDYGTVRFATGAPRAGERTDSTRVWHAGTGAHAITLTVIDRGCRDAMSGRPFPRTVRVEVDGETLEGCGRWLGREDGR